MSVSLAEVFLQDQFEARVLQQILVVPYEKVQYETGMMGAVSSPCLPKLARDILARCSSDTLLSRAHYSQSTQCRQYRQSVRCAVGSVKLDCRMLKPWRRPPGHLAVGRGRLR